MAKNNGEFTFEIIEHICDLSDTTEKVWTKELNIVSWNGGKPKADIRDWDEDHTHCGKGATLTSAECDVLYDGLEKLAKHKFQEVKLCG